MVCFYYRKGKKELNMINEDEMCMQAAGEEPSEESKRMEALRNKEETILKKMGYTYNCDIHVWWSDDLQSLPVLKDSEARSLADEIIDFVLK